MTQASQPRRRADAFTPRKLTYKEQREFEQLPDRIDAFEREQRELGEAVAAADFYKQPAIAITETLERLAAIERELVELYARWDALDSRAI